jgi:uncharacterized membrane protein HdeD (DUF308 family)
MNALTAAGWTVRITGVALLIVGLLIWANVARALVPLHMLIGIVLVLALWAAAVLALRAGAKPVLPAVAVAWGLLMVVFGLNQAQILPGSQHVIVEVAHLLVGIVAIGLGEALVGVGRRGAASIA